MEAENILTIFSKSKTNKIIMFKNKNHNVKKALNKAKGLLGVSTLVLSWKVHTLVHIKNDLLK